MDTPPADNVTGSNWTENEVYECVERYLQCLRKDVAGEHFNKAAVYRELSDRNGRSTSSIEFKFQNISAVLDELGFEWISGLAPMGNYQRLLAETIEAREDDLADMSKLETTKGFEDLASLYIEPAPERASTPIELPEYMVRLARKFDPVQRDLQNRELGEAGEALVVEYEKRALEAADRKDLSQQVTWVSKEEGDGAGYDILSFDPRGEKKFIEVKTTNGGNRTAFYISRNEYGFSKQNAEKFHLMRLFNFRRQPRAFSMHGPLDSFVRLSTETYRADFRA